ncbi:MULTISPECIES: restriction endonuclease subunit S [Nitrosomonas]|uniref:Type I restriction enzyme S subunit n=1 Tax=Nitrosomonas communis TaxID=44574 RepID=A0A5D3Y8N7_9PROT|nr:MULTISPECIES: restriction endonuclease subunit S [Nitrosomonas]TYP78787.1 type I restriction enzyme S subunit [Nitrosomonas communis]UVS61915.1 restriction endonuclease subunit S [Nitrosomonas sp. PLL12]
MAGEWQMHTLGDLTVNHDSKRKPVKEADRKPGPYPYYGASGIVDYVDDYLIDGNYLLIAEDGENLRTRQTPITFMARGKSWVNNHAHIVTGNEKTDTLFLMYALQATDISGYLTGAVMPKLTQGNLNKIQISCPSLDEQRAIAHILGTLDDKIELNRRMNETQEAIARAIFKSWFVDFDPVRAKASGEPSESICRRLGLTPDLLALFPDRFQDSELGEIPERWQIGTFGDVAEHPRRGIQPTEIAPTTPYIALEHMPRRCIALSDWDMADGLESNKFQFKKGEILFGKLRPYFHKVGVAPIDGVCSTDIVVVAPKAEGWFGFVLGHISSDAFVEHTNAGSTGTKMPRTNWNDMVRFQIVIPSNIISDTFTSLVRPMVERIIALIYEGRTLAGLRDALLPKLLSGKLRVPSAENLAEATS